MQAELEATLATLISIPSVTSDSTACHEIIDVVRSEVESHGLFIHSDTTIPNPWFFATTKDTKQPDILFVAHLDVVPANPDLFLMQKQEGKLFGRGVYDMKLAAACYMEFLRNHSDKLHELNIGYLFTTDEETGGHCFPTILATGLRPKVVFIPDGGDNWAVEKRAKGFVGLKFVARGESAHASRPWEGRSALHTLLDVTQLLRARYPLTRDPAACTLTVNTLHAGEAINQLPDYATATVDFRSFQKDELTAFRQLITQLANEYSLEASVTQEGEPLIFDTEAPGIDTFLRTLQAHTGQDEITYRESYGASDGRYFAPYNIPCIIIEPYGGGRHSNEEWLQADDLPNYYRLIERWIFAKS
ncbi:MAG TPA: M20 family metallopeptidase [Candidatus Saccharimonadales bacterium]|nr:M20 family metallopeptidase [Candidatus Saccharimonadales bacterium]